MIWIGVSETDNLPGHLDKYLSAPSRPFLCIPWPSAVSFLILLSSALYLKSPSRNFFWLRPHSGQMGSAREKYKTQPALPCRPPREGSVPRLKVRYQFPWRTSWRRPCRRTWGGGGWWPGASRVLITHLSACSASLALCTSSSLSVIVPGRQYYYQTLTTPRQVGGPHTGPHTAGIMVY